MKIILYISNLTFISYSKEHFYIDISILINTNQSLKYYSTLPNILFLSQNSLFHYQSLI